jgi:uncharacterized protein (DUF952 family)
LDSLIFHITHRPDWEKALLDGAYTAPSLAGQGFIHCSYAHQVVRVANLVILVVDSKSLTSPVKVEKAVDVEDDYPHIYGSINLKAVVKVVDFPPSRDFTFQLPAELI